MQHPRSPAETTAPPTSGAPEWLRPLRGGFARSVLTLASGTAVAQLLLVLAVPVLTRLYTPADYGVLAVYSSTLAVLVVLASLRYEAAIPLPDDERTAGSLLVLTLGILAAMAALVSMLVWLLGDAFVTAVNVPALRPYLWLIPAGFVGAGAYQMLSYWAIRHREFRRVARTRLSQGGGQVVVQIALGIGGAGALGLIVGDLVGRVAGAGGLALAALRRRPVEGVTPASIRAVATRYRRFPLLTTWSGLFNIGSLQLASIVFSAAFGAAAAGLYAISFKVLVLPTMLVAQAVGQVFLSRAARLTAEPAHLRRLTERTALGLFAAGLPAFLTVALAGPQLFAVVLGREWEESGRYAQVLAPWFALWLVSNPLSGLLSVREWQGSALAFSAFELVLRLGALLVGAARGSPMLAVALLSAGGVIIATVSIVRFLLAGHSSAGRLLGPAVRVAVLAIACLLPAALILRAGHGRTALAVGALAIVAYYALVARSALAPGFLHLGADSSVAESAP
ncbi:MAG TPA: lipopolysaccharide biosynthesis protein [Gemmatimonadales bacterium]|nr:lipopolysaccharide biosynthesis protein [Gemmatimonadales bacterium]